MCYHFEWQPGSDSGLGWGYVDCLVAALASLAVALVLASVNRRSFALAPVTWELLFVSDGSTDGSSKFIQEWTQVDPFEKLDCANAELRPSKCDICRPLIRVGKARRNYGRGFAG